MSSAGILFYMEGSPHQSLAAEIEDLLGQHGGPMVVPGQRGDYVMMRPDIYAAMLGMAKDEESEALASVRRGLADLNAGRVQDLDDAFNDLDAR